MERRKRWTISVPEEKIAPAGGRDAFERAKAEIAPFDQKHSRRPCHCEKCGEESIIEVARKFNQIRFQMVGAPRAKQVSRNLEEVARAARRLAATLAGLDDYSRRWLRLKIKPQGDEPDLRPLHERARANDLPPPSNVAAGDGLFVQDLQALSTYADEMALLFGYRGLMQFPNDLGGATNIVTQLKGTPNEALVFGAYVIMLNHQPKKISKTENGAFHRLVNEIRLFATGSRKGEASTLAYIKNHLGPGGRWKRPSQEDLDREHEEWLRESNWPK